MCGDADLVHVKVQLYRRGEGFSDVKDVIAGSTTVRILLEGRHVATMEASPSMLCELGAGYVVSHGLRGPLGVSAELAGPSVVDVRAPQAFSRPRPLEVSVSAETLMSVQSLLNALGRTYAMTGGTHVAVLLRPTGDLVTAAEDVSRHGAIDKVLGHAVLRGIDTRGLILGVSCRLSEAIVRKAVNAGLPMIVSVAAPTFLGIARAMEGRVTLVGRAKKDSFKVYAKGAGRIVE